jgi:acetolactate synthase-1/2/3 large subunit
MAIYDASIDTGLQLFHTRHEAATVHMADVVGRLTGKPGVALVAAGPGFANCLSALYVAKAAESPVLLLSGDSPHELDGQGAFMELDQVAMSQLREFDQIEGPLEFVRQRLLLCLHGDQVCLFDRDHR